MILVKRNSFSFFLFSLVVFLLSSGSYSYAQQSIEEVDEKLELLEESGGQESSVSVIGIREKAAIEGKDVSVQDFSPLLFTPDEYALLMEARRRLQTRAPTSGEIDQDWVPPGSPGIREISLSGIVYKTPKVWTIWLNQQRITPTAIPSEVLDLRVFKDYIELKWYDEYTNKIFPIRLRAHQRFNLDSRMFLPG